MSDPYAAFSDPVRPAAPGDVASIFPHLVQQESGGRAGAVGPQTRYGRAQGRTQMLPATAREMAGVVGVPWRPDLMTGQTPEAAAYQDRLGQAYLQQGYERTGNMRDALRYYHGGPDRRLWGENTNRYADEVLARAGQSSPPPQPPQTYEQAREAGYTPDPTSDPYASIASPVDSEQAGRDATMARWEHRGDGGLARLNPFSQREWWVGRTPHYMDRNAVIGDIEGPDGQTSAISGVFPRVRLTASGPQIFDPISFAYYDATQDEVDAVQRQAESDRKERILRLGRQEDPKYRAEFARAQAGAENVPDPVAALLAGQTLGGKGIVPYVTGAVSYLDAVGRGVDPNMASQAGRDATRDVMDDFQREHPGQNLGYQLFGGLFTPGMKGAGDWVGDASGLERTARAAVVGGGMGAGSGLLNSSGDAGDRASQTVLGGATGLATGGLLDAGVQRAMSAPAGVASSGRLLSREGVNLTPGQMMAGIPGVGPVARAIEDNATGFLPFVQSARNRGVEDLQRASANRALSNIGETLPRRTAPGYATVEAVQNRLGAAYDDVLPRVSAQLDQPLYTEIAGILDNAASEMPQDKVQQLARVLESRVFRNVDQADATISGDQFKRIESELGAMARSYRNANDPAAQAFGESVSDIQSALRNMIARQNPAEAERIGQINAGYAHLVRMERASGNAAAMARGGVPTPGEFANAVSQGAGRSERGRGGALMQDLAVAGREVLPNKVGDSGTAGRALVGMGLLGGATVAPQVAVPVIASAVAYSKPAQALLNAIYRATDPAVAAPALANLQRFAGRNPALQPYYQTAVQHVQDALEGPSQGPEPARAGLLSPTR